MRAYVICLFIKLLVCGCLSSSGQQLPTLPKMIGARYSTAPDSSVKPFVNFSPRAYVKSTDVKPAGMLREDYYTQRLGFFCTKELQLEKMVRMPLRVRLGSVDYCDRMEGKRKQ